MQTTENAEGNYFNHAAGNGEHGCNGTGHDYDDGQNDDDSYSSWISLDIS